MSRGDLVTPRASERVGDAAGSSPWPTAGCSDHPVNAAFAAATASVDVDGVARGDGGEELLGGGVDHLERVGPRGRDPCAVDVGWSYASTSTQTTRRRSRCFSVTHPPTEWVLLHLIVETARHAGHADLVRDRRRHLVFPLMAAAEGWPTTPWMQPWEKREPVNIGHNTTALVRIST